MTTNEKNLHDDLQAATWCDNLTSIFGLRGNDLTVAVARVALALLHHCDNDGPRSQVVADALRLEEKPRTAPALRLVA
jgi:hypothetical protein